MSTRRRKRVVRNTRKKGGALLSPEQTRIVAIRQRGKNHSQKMAEHLRGLVEQLKEQYNGGVYRTFIKEQAVKWSEADQFSKNRLTIINDIARYRLNRKWMIHAILTLRNQEAQNISNYMKTASMKKLSNHRSSALTHQVQQHAINNSIIEIEKRIGDWNNKELQEHPIVLFEFNDDTYYKIIAIHPTDDMPLNKSIEIKMKPEQYPAVEEWIAGCRDLLDSIKLNIPNPNIVSPLYLLLYYVLKNYAYSLNIHSGITPNGKRQSTFYRSSAKRSDKVRLRSATLFLEWKEYQLSDVFNLSNDPRILSIRRKIELQIKKINTDIEQIKTALRV